MHRPCCGCRANGAYLNKLTPIHLFWVLRDISFARRVKVADILNRMNLVRLGQEITEKDVVRLRKNINGLLSNSRASGPRLAIDLRATELGRGELAQTRSGAYCARESSQASPYFAARAPASGRRRLPAVSPEADSNPIKEAVIDRR
jgi:hypothetical protein